MKRGKSILGTIAAIVVALVAWWQQQQRQRTNPRNNDGASTQANPDLEITRGTEGNAARIEGECVHVVDGDTVHVQTRDGRKIIVRVLGIDTMECVNLDKAESQAKRLRSTRGKVVAWGKEALAVGESQLKRKQVTLVLPLGKPDYDPHDRLLAYVEIDGEDYGEGLLRQGLAEARREAHARRGHYQRIDEASRAARRGIYGSLR